MKAPLGGLLAGLRTLLALGAALCPALACAGDLPSLGTQVSARFSGYTWVRSSATFNTVATLSNASQLRYSGNLRLVVASLAPETATLANASGQGNDGRPYVDVVLPATGLAPGGTVTATLAFRNPSGQPIRFTHRVEGVPEGFPATLTLALGAPAAAPGQALDVQWSSAGTLPTGAAIQLRATAPVVDTTSVPLTTQWYRSAAGAWSATPEAVPPAAGAAKLRLTLPSRAQGPWRIEALLVDGSGTVRARVGRSLLVADQPSARLSLSRPLANSADLVLARVTLAAGAVPMTVRLMAWLVTPDGRTLGLPGLQAERLEVYRGPSKNASFTLLERAFAPTEQGSYRVHVGLYDGDGRVLGVDGAGLQVCDAPATISGVVRDASGVPIDPGAYRSASVVAVNLDEKSATAAALLSDIGGRYQLTVPPGRYGLLATLTSGRVVRRGGIGRVTLTCGTQPAVYDIAIDDR